MIGQARHQGEWWRAFDFRLVSELRSRYTSILGASAVQYHQQPVGVFLEFSQAISMDS